MEDSMPTLHEEIIADAELLRKKRLERESTQVPADALKLVERVSLEFVAEKLRVRTPKKHLSTTPDELREFLRQDRAMDGKFRQQLGLPPKP